MQGGTALIGASAQGHVPIIKELLAAGAFVQAADYAVSVNPSQLCDAPCHPLLRDKEKAMPFGVIVGTSGCNQKQPALLHDMSCHLNHILLHITAC